MLKVSTDAQGKGLEIIHGTHLSSLNRTWTRDHDIAQVTDSLGVQIQGNLAAIVDTNIFRNHRNSGNLRERKTYKLQIYNNEVVVKYRDGTSVPLIETATKRVQSIDPQIQEEARGILFNAKEIIAKARSLDLASSSYHAPYPRSTSPHIFHRDSPPPFRRVDKQAKKEMEELRQQLENSEEGRADAEERSQQLRHELQSVTRERDLLLNELKSQEEELRSLRGVREELKNTQLSCIRDHQEMLAVLQQAEAKISELQLALEMEQRRAQSATQDFETLKRRYNEKVFELESARQEVVLVRRENVTLKEERDLAHLEVRRLSSRISSLETRFLELSSERDRLQNAESGRIDAESELLITKSQLQQLRQMIESQSQSLLFSEQERLSLRERIEKLEALLLQKETAISSIQLECKQALEKQNLLFQQEIQRLQEAHLQETSSLKREIKSYLERLASAEKDNEIITSLKDENLTLSQTNEKLKALLSDLEQRDQTRALEHQHALEFFQQRALELESQYKMDLALINEEHLVARKTLELRIRELESSLDGSYELLEASNQELNGKVRELAEVKLAFQNAKIAFEEELRRIEERYTTTQQEQSQTIIELKLSITSIQKEKERLEREAHTEGVSHIEEIQSLKEQLESLEDQLRSQTQLVREQERKIEFLKTSLNSQREQAALELEEEMGRVSIEKEALQRELDNLSRRLNLLIAKLPKSFADEISPPTTPTAQLELLERLIDSTMTKGEEKLEEAQSTYQTELEKLSREYEETTLQLSEIQLILKEREQTIRSLEEHATLGDSTNSVLREENTRLQGLNRKLLAQKFANETRIRELEEEISYYRQDLETLEKEKRRLEEKHQIECQQITAKLNTSHEESLEESEREHSLELERLKQSHLQELAPFTQKIRALEKLLEEQQDRITSLEVDQEYFQTALKNTEERSRKTTRELHQELSELGQRKDDLERALHQLKTKRLEELSRQADLILRYYQSDSTLPREFSELASHLTSRQALISYLEQNPEEFTRAIRHLVDGVIQQSKVDRYWENQKIEELKALLTQMDSIIQGDDVPTEDESLLTLKNELARLRHFEEEFIKSNQSALILAEENQSLQEELQQLREALQNESAAAEILDKELQASKEREARAKREIASLTEEFQIAEKAQEIVFQTYRESESSLKFQISKLKEELSSSSNEQERLRSEIQQRDQEISLLRTRVLKLEELEDLRRRLQAAEIDKQKAEERVSTLSQEAVQWRETALTALKAKDLIELELARAKEELLSTKAELQQAKRQISEQQEALTEKDRLIQTLQLEINSLKSENERLRLRLQEMERQVQETDRLRQALLSSEAENEALRRQNRELQEALDREKLVNNEAAANSLQELFQLATKLHIQPITLDGIEESVMISLDVNHLLTPRYTTVIPPIREENAAGRSSNIGATVYRTEEGRRLRLRSRTSTNLGAADEKIRGGVTKMFGKSSSASDPDSMLKRSYPHIYKLFQNIQEIMPFNDPDFQETLQNVQKTNPPNLADVLKLKNKLTLSVTKFVHRCVLPVARNGTGTPYIVRDLRILLAYCESMGIEGETKASLETLLNSFEYLFENMTIEADPSSVGTTKYKISFFKERV